MNAPQRWQPLLTGVLWLGGLVLLYLVLKYVAPFFAPFLFALVLAVLIDPTVDGLEERLHFPRGWAVVVALLFFFGLVVGLVLFGVGAVAVQLGQLSIDLPAQYDKLVAFSESLLARATEAFSGLSGDIVGFVESSVRGGLQTVYLGLQSLAGTFLTGLKVLPSAFLVAVITLVATFFISRDKQLISDFLLSLLPASARERVAAVNRDVLSSAIGLVKAQLTLVGLTLAITVAGLYLLGVRYAWLAGFVTGVLDVLPAVGPAIVLVPWAVYCYVDGNVFLGTGLMVLLGVITVFRRVMELRIIGQRLGLHPLVALLSLYLGIRLLGAAGLIVGPLGAIVIKAVARSGQAPPRARPPRARTRPPVAAAGPQGEPAGAAGAKAGPEGPAGAAPPGRKAR